MERINCYIFSSCQNVGEGASETYVGIMYTRKSLKNEGNLCKSERAGAKEIQGFLGISRESWGDPKTFGLTGVEGGCILLYEHASCIGPWPDPPPGNPGTGGGVFLILAAFLQIKRSRGVLQAMGTSRFEHSKQELPALYIYQIVAVFVVHRSPWGS